MSVEEKLIATLRQRGPTLLSDLVALGVMSSERALLRVAGASEGRIVQDGAQLLLPGPEDTEPEPDPDGRLSEYVIFDLETTSANPEQAEIIELAAVRVRDGQEVDTFQRLVRGPKLSAEITNLTSITPQMLMDEGQPLDAVLNDFLVWAGALPLLGHNALKYDLPVLRRALATVNREWSPRPVLDSLLLAPWPLPVTPRFPRCTAWGHSMHASLETRTPRPTGRWTTAAPP